VADKLDVQIDTASAKAGLDGLHQSVNSLGQSLAALQSQGSGAFSKLVADMASLRGLDAGVSSTFQNVAASISGMQSSISKVSAAPLDAVKASIAAFDSARILATSEAMGALAGAADRLGVTAKNAGGAFSSLTQGASGAGSSLSNTTSLSGALGAALGGLGGNLGFLVGQFGAFGTAATTAFGAFTQLTGAGFPPGISVGAALATGAIVTLAASIVPLISEVIRLNNVFISFQAIMDSLRGAGGGKQAFQDITNIAMGTGVSIESLSKNMGKFSAAAKQAGVDTAGVNKIFTNVSASMTLMGVSAEANGRVFTALTQIMSKGKVSMEELRQQLGDSLPGAMDAMARAVGVSIAQLEHMVANGQVSSSILGKFSEELYKVSGGADAMAKALRNPQAQMTIFQNSLVLIAKAFGDGGGLGGFMANFAIGLAQINGALQNPGFQAFARVLGDIAGVIANVLLSAVAAFLNVLAGMAAAVSGMLGGLSALGAVFSAITNYLGITSTVGKAASEAFAILSTTIQVAATALGLIIALSLVSTLAGWIGALGTAAACLR
jgi:tape measure domain-containing protein